MHEGISYIPKNCFQNCSSLVTVDGIDAVTEIGSFAFSGCSSLETLICGTINSIGREAFRECTSLKTIGTLRVSTIPSYAFAGCSSLLWFDLAIVTVVEENAFENCKAFDQIIIPDSCVFIDDCAFAGTSGVKHIYIGKNLAPEYESVDSNGGPRFCAVDIGRAFDRASLESIQVSEHSEYWYESGNCLLRKPQVDKDNNIVITLLLGCNNSVIPNEVTHIGAFAFQNCTKLTEISLPNSIKEISKSAFGDCTGLQAIVLPDRLKKIGFSAFEGCKSLQSITIPNSVEFIGSNAF